MQPWTHTGGSLGAIADYDRTRPAAVTSLMHVGSPDGLGGLGPDLSGTARTLGWAAAATWAYAKFYKKDEGLAEKALPYAIGGWVASILL